MRTVVVHHESGKLRQEVQIGPHHLVSDVGANEGGEDAGPTPHEYLAASLASCKAITMRMYAQRKNWPLEDAEVAVSIVHEGDLTQFNCKIVLKGVLDQPQRSRLLEIASHCPIHKTLSGKIEIQTQAI